MTFSITERRKIENAETKNEREPSNDTGIRTTYHLQQNEVERKKQKKTAPSVVDRFTWFLSHLRNFSFFGQV